MKTMIFHHKWEMVISVVSDRTTSISTTTCRRILWVAWGGAGSPSPPKWKTCRLSLGLMKQECWTPTPWRWWRVLDVVFQMWRTSVTSRGRAGTRTSCLTGISFKDVDVNYHAGDKTSVRTGPEQLSLIIINGRVPAWGTFCGFCSNTNRTGCSETDVTLSPDM